MTDSIIFLLGSSLPILVIGIVWIMVHYYSPRLSRIDEELHAISVMLSEMPNEMSLQEYMFSQDQRLRSITERLDAHSDPALLQQQIQELTQQLRQIVSVLEETGRTELTRADIEDSLRVTNDSLEKVLWSMRFDEDKYLESTANAVNASPVSGNAKVDHLVKHRKKDREAPYDAKSMRAILNDSDDRYDAMLKYMKQTGESGSNALQALDTVGGVRSG